MLEAVFLAGDVCFLLEMVDGEHCPPGTLPASDTARQEHARTKFVSLT